MVVVTLLYLHLWCPKQHTQNQHQHHLTFLLATLAIAAAAAADLAHGLEHHPHFPPDRTKVLQLQLLQTPSSTSLLLRHHHHIPWWRYLLQTSGLALSALFSTAL
jgi:hypothetical protein